MRLGAHLYPAEVARLVQDPRPMDELVAEYMADQDPAYQVSVARDVATMEPRATEAFMEARGVEVPVPVLIGVGERRYIERALAQYTLQPRHPSFSVLGYLNWPAGTPAEQIDAMRAVLLDFIARKPGVPFGFIEGELPGPFSPPRERRRVSDTLLSFAATDNPRDMLVVPHDTDLTALSPNHFRDLHRPFASNPFVLSVTPHVAHERSRHLPNMDTVIKWVEESCWETGDYMEPGPGVSARALMAVKSYRDDHTLGETHGLIANIHGVEDLRLDVHPGSVAVRGAVLTLSPRRFYNQFYQGRGPMEIWSSKEPLSADDEYRHLSFDGWIDLPISIRDQMLREYGAAVLQGALTWRVLRGMSPKRAFEASVKGLEQLHRRIGGPGDMILRAARDMVIIEGGDD